METVLKEDQTYIRDVIHGEIPLDPLAKKIIETKEFKRLKGISQTGSAKYVFTRLADENRYFHSIGAYHIMSRIIEHFEKCLKPYGISISPYHKKMAKMAMLLHDIGHGPLSHTMERVIGYSHEKNTVAIIKDKDSEIYKVLSEAFSSDEIDSLISFIQYENNGESSTNNEKDNIIDILKLLVSNQIDADRLDYLIRDAYYADYKSSIDLTKIINGFYITIDRDKWLLFGKQNCLTQFETVLFERQRNYHDIYFNPTALRVDYIIRHAINLIGQDSEVISALSPALKDLIEKRDSMSLKSFLELNDELIESMLSNISQQHNDELLGYVCNIEKNIEDYIFISPEKDVASICRRLSLIFSKIPNIEQFDFLKNCILVDTNIALKTYKSNSKEGIYINQYGNIVNIDKCSSIISQNPIQVKARFINFNLLKLYLNIDEKTFEEEYMPKLNKLIEWINYPEWEFELKYLKRDDLELNYARIMEIFKNEGFVIASENVVLNTDFYYDTAEFELFETKRSMRIRIKEMSDSNKVEYEITYKSPTDEKANFSIRSEKTDVMTGPNIKEAMAILKNKNIAVDNILSSPILKVINNRHIVDLEKNGVHVELAFDNVVYENLLNNQRVTEQMVEVELKLGSEISDRLILSEIYKIIESKMPELMLDIESNKYFIGLTKTHKKEEQRPLVKRKETN